MLSHVTSAHVPFNPAELATLRAHGIVLFAGRVIFDAQPPMANAEMARVQRSCAGPLPDQLRLLWQVTAGGQVDYDLALTMLGQQEAISWVELFFNGSDGYHDLQGWIDHELELIAEAADRPRRGWPRRTKLTHLPFGGFEYCDRIYIGVARGAEHGQVVAWKQGLPPAWTGQLHEDTVAELARSLTEPFARLHLDEDPLSPVSDFFAGRSLLRYLDERRDHGLDDSLRDKLVDYYRQALVDWASPLAAGTLARDSALAQVALNHAIAVDDPRLVARLGAAGVSLDAPFTG